MPDFNDLSYALGGYKRSNPYEARRKLAYAMAQQASDSSPIQSPWQGASRLAQGLIGGYGIYKADADEKAAETARNAKLAEAMAEQDPQKKIGLISAIDPEIGMRGGIQLAVEQAKLQQQQAALKTGSANFGAGYRPPQGPMQASGPPVPLTGYQGTLAGAESRNNPQAVNPQSGAGGAFQFMPATWADVRKNNPHLNLPENVLQASEQQQAQAEEAFRAGNAKALQAAGIPPTPANLYLAHRAGAQGAQTILQASPDAPLSTVVPPEWIQQNPDMRTTVGNFLAQANQRFPGGGQPQPAPGVVPPGPIAQPPPQQIAQAPPGQRPGQPPQIAQGGGDGTPPQPNPAGVNGPAVIAPPGVPDVPRPQPSPQQIQQYQQRIQSGEFGIGPEAVSKARAALDADLDRQWTVDRERRFKEFDQQQGSYRFDREQQAENARHQRGLQDKKDNPQYTQEQNLAHTYATRLNNAIPQLEALARDPGKIPSWAEQMNAISPYYPEPLVSDKAKEFRRVAKDIMSATLRRESGASIHSDEYTTEAQKFIPQPGDSPDIVANKLAALKQAARSIAEGTGRRVESYSFFGGAPAAGSGAAPSQGSGMPPPPPGFRPLP